MKPQKHTGEPVGLLLAGALLARVGLLLMVALLAVSLSARCSSSESAPQADTAEGRGR
jgi:hypothetical protein